MENRLVFTVSELTKHIKATLEPVYQDIWVEGEVSNMRIPSSGHCYFTLKDETSQIRAVIFRTQNRLLRFILEDGLKVICRARINIYEPRGEYQLIVEIMEPKGIGELQLAFEQLKKRLQEEGLFDDANKKPLPFMPQKVGVITSSTGAAVRDVIKILTRRFPNIGIIIVPVKVQGDEAPDEIADALALASEINLADVLILARGGGSIEDLWAFNTEKVARAIVSSTIPVVSAVGHEIDFTISDFAADLRAPTPSAAAELVVKEKKELVQLLVHSGSRLRNILSQYCERHRARVKYCFSHLRYPAQRITDYKLRVDDIYMRLVQTVPKAIKHKKSDIQRAHKIVLSHAPLPKIVNKKTQTRFLTKNLCSQMQSITSVKAQVLKNFLLRLNAYNPLSILERGFSITRIRPSMKVAKDSRQLKQGDTVQVTLHKGIIDCLVKKVLH